MRDELANARPADGNAERDAWNLAFAKAQMLQTWTAMATIESHVEKNLSKLEDQLKLWTAKVKAGIAKANVAGKEAKIDSRKQLDELKSKLDVAQSKLEKAKAAGSEKWETLKDDVEHTWKELEGAFKKLIH